MYLLLRMLFVAAGLWLAARYVPGVRIDGAESLIIAAMVLALINALVRPIIILLTLPITIVSLGLFLFVINAATFMAVGWFVRGFHVHGFVPALMGSIVVWFAGFVGSAFIGPEGRFDRIERRRERRFERRWR
jgi:putative membrane protein